MPPRAQKKPVLTGAQTWRIAWGLRVFAGLCLSVLIVIGSLLAFDGARTSDRASGWCFLVITPVAGWLLFVRPYVELSTGFLYVRNPIRSRLIPLEDIRDTRPLNTGLGLLLTNGDQVVAWALQQGLLMTVFAAETRATRAARAIQDAAEAARGR